MAGRELTGLMYVNTDVDAVHKRDEYQRWYLDVHFPEVTAPGIFTRPRMFRNSREPLPGGERSFLALYETDWPDVEAAAEAADRHTQHLFAERRIHPGTRGGLFAIYRRIALGGELRRAHSLVAVHVDAAEGGDEALRRWGASCVASDSPALELCQRGAWFERIESGAFAAATRSDQPRFLLLFESDRGDPGWLAERLAETLALAKSPGAVLHSVSSFHRASP